MNSEEVFQLIDRVLPFEACLFHQILPLSIQHGKLHLGMVMLNDVAAIDYARQMAGYQNYSLIPQSLSSETHHSVLTAYLNYSQNRPAPSKPQPTASLEAGFHDKDTLVLEVPDEQTALETDAPEAQATVQNPYMILPDLPVSTRYAEEPIALLAQLPPSRLLKELLGRVLGNGIGRLFFERRERYGRILWSQNGTIQSVIETIALNKFQALIDELKHLTRLPLFPVTEIQQVEIERSYQRDRVLLRLRITPTEAGEQATLQVLRGAALKFYQRQQLTSLSRDALTIATRLQQKINELHHTATPLAEPRNVVPEIDQVMQIVEQQLTELKQIRDSYTEKN
ncbi:hypothetical protein H6F51_05320 [Cyanobacteria bacterium FACHB-DQ100]|nr:hypothetical protein [Cyanobacteria bacterium FACHB-DQ100]